MIASRYIGITKTVNEDPATLSEVPHSWKEKGGKLQRRNVCTIIASGVSLLGFHQLGSSIYYLQSLVFGTTCYDLSYASFVWALGLPFLQIFEIGCLIKYSDSPLSLVTTLATTTSLHTLRFNNRGVDITFKKFISSELGKGISRNTSLRRLDFVDSYFDYDEIFSHDLHLNTSLISLKMITDRSLSEKFDTQKDGLAVIAKMPLLYLKLYQIFLPHEFFLNLSPTLQSLSLKQYLSKPCSIHLYLSRTEELKILKTRGIIYPIPARYFPTSLTSLDIMDEMETSKSTQYYRDIVTQLTLLSLPRVDNEDVELLRANTSLAVLKLKVSPKSQFTEDEMGEDYPVGYSDVQTCRTNQLLQELVNTHTTLQVLKLSSCRIVNFRANFFPGTNLTALYLKGINCRIDFYEKLGKATSLRRLDIGNVSHIVREAIPIFKLPHITYLNGVGLTEPCYRELMKDSYSLIDVNSCSIYNPSRIPEQLLINGYNELMKATTLFELLIQHSRSKILRCPGSLEYSFSYKREG